MARSQQVRVTENERAAQDARKLAMRKRMVTKSFIEGTGRQKLELEKRKTNEFEKLKLEKGKRMGSKRYDFCFLSAPEHYVEFLDLIQGLGEPLWSL